MAGDILMSEWGSLSPHLLASIYPVDRDGWPLADEPTVVAPPLEASVELSANWHSPFENMGPESKAPALMAMLQTGMITTAFMSLTGAASAALANGASKVGIDLSRYAKATADDLDAAFASGAGDVQGITGMTKLNATQVFTGAAPVRFSLQLLFRAFSDPKREVSAPVDQLSQWILPLDLSVEGSITGAIRGLAAGDGLLKSLFPSRAPRYLGLRYAGYVFSPLVVETLSYPLNSPMSHNGVALNKTVSITLASVTALDAGDWRRAGAKLPVRMFQTSKR